MSTKKENKFAQYPRKLIHSQAFQNLNTPGHRVLSFVRLTLITINLGTKQNPNWVCSNKNEIQILYADLAKKPWSMKNGTITRGIDELLHKGFININEQGGKEKGHASIYGLSEDYLKWKPGDDPVSVRRPYGKRGFCVKPKIES